MYMKIDLSGIWKFRLDEEKQGMHLPYNDTIVLPNTTSHAKKGNKNEAVEIWHLTDEYQFEGYAWFSREFEVSEQVSHKNCFLYLERTRVTTVWIDGSEIGTQYSLTTPHIYNISNFTTPGIHRITILVDNTNYPTKGGHLTSPDTQTNWNGITGAIELRVFHEAFLEDIQVYPDVQSKSFLIKSKVIGADSGIITVSAESVNGRRVHNASRKVYAFSSDSVSIIFPLGEEALLWSEYEPNLYKLALCLTANGTVMDVAEVTAGLRDFRADGDKFAINGIRTFLRGKHDGLIFPLTGFAPTTVDEWLKVLNISKSYGINHYRFHTCCPPEAAFTAADMLGIYMEPELPFWGTITDENDEKHNQAEQDYLINEGFAMLKSYGNHPSFTMMSLGNELWGSKKRLNEILKGYKAYDNRHLYTQGSNNFQFTPQILEEEDFFCGVRFSRDRLFRGSYAMCDAPLGHVQVSEPGTMHDYDEMICPPYVSMGNAMNVELGNMIEIQYGTGVKKVKAESSSDMLIPGVPVVSHEIGQYETYPNYDEINKYKGSLKAKNLEIFKKRLHEKGLGNLAKKYFECSGKLAVQCYKEELEAAFRSKRLAGFQILDLQDFSGQGTALVGVLDAFMEPKGIISPEEWRGFCSDAVLLARFPKYNYISDETFTAHIELAYYRNTSPDGMIIIWKLIGGNTVYSTGKSVVNSTDGQNHIDICDININMPAVPTMQKLCFSIEMDGADIRKSYDLWVYPSEISIDKTGISILDDFSDKAISLLEKGENVLLLPKPDQLKNSVEGFYCQDFWCYPMFRTISESINKPLPVGTMGLLVNNTHPVFRYFQCEEYSTYHWWNIVSNSCSVVLDETQADFHPIVQTIDNFERNHKLGLMFECNVANGKLFVCACDFEKIQDRPEGKQLLYSILHYVTSAEFKPLVKLGICDMKKALANSNT